MLLNDDQKALLAAARRFSRDRLLPAYQLREQQGKMDRTVLREMGQLGLLGVKGGLYGGLNGWFQGDDRGKLYVEHERWNLADPATRKLARTLCDHVIEVRDGDEVGYGIMEYGVGKGYAKYEAVQHHPPI